MNLVADFTAVFKRMIDVAPCALVVTAPDGTAKYSCNGTSGVFPRVVGMPNAYDQERLQFTHLASAGEPAKFDQVTFTTSVDALAVVTRTIQEVRPHRVAGVVIAYRIIVEG